MKDFSVGCRQSPLGPEVSASLQDRHWEQLDVAEVSNERKRKENSTGAGSGHAGRNGTGARRVHGQAARSEKGCFCMISTDFLCSFYLLAVCLLLCAERNRTCPSE